ncbi:MAG: hypothetical protein A2776_01175 [Candidatus Levybacteria bacterium RIFCSPHIGHO2_01_FULL_40_10]|nr:MAG: hypothetical protein A2776_01175 [Candidatus Levybacteria bacterium RIFCSPHIGHO2_01_FULL_40_10]
MKRYVKPSIKVRKLRLNNFLTSQYINPFSGLGDFLQIGTVFAESGGNISPPGTGTAGLKDQGFRSRLGLKPKN